MADLHTAEPSGKITSYTGLEQALQKAYQTFSCHSYFRGVDIGYRWKQGQRTDEICLRLHIARKLPLEVLRPEQVLPSHVAGFPLDLIPASYQPSLEPGASRRASARPPYAMGGLSCGRSGEGAGTIGLVVIDKTTGKPAILSNWHVLAGPRAHRNDPIMLLGECNDEFDPRNHIANLKRWMLDRNGDAAIAELLPDQPWLPLQFDGLEAITKTRPAQLGETLNKTSQSATGPNARVDGKGLYRLQYETRPGVLEYRDIEGLNLVYETGTSGKGNKASSAGDSGSAWVSASSGDAVALQIGGQIAPDGAVDLAGQGIIACSIDTIFEKLDLRLANFNDLLAQNGQVSAFSHHQEMPSTFSTVSDEDVSPKHWPHPQYWLDASAPQTPLPTSRANHSAPVADIVPLVRIMRSEPTSCQDWGSKAVSACRYSTAQDIWRNRLYPALLGYDPNFRGALPDEPVSKKIWAADATSVYAFLSRIINTSAHFEDIGGKHVSASDFRGTITYMQVCDRIATVKSPI